MSETSIGEIKTLIEAMRKDAGDREERTIARATKSELAIDGLSRGFTTLNERMNSYERDQDESSRIARKALESNHDLEGVLTREVSALQSSNAAQNVALRKLQSNDDEQTKALTEIIVATKDIVTSEIARRSAAVARDKTLDRVDKYVKILVGLVALAGVVWVIFTFAVKEVELRPRPPTTVFTDPSTPPPK